MELVKTLLSFALALGILVTVHEFGHYWVAQCDPLRDCRSLADRCACRSGARSSPDVRRAWHRRDG